MLRITSGKHKNRKLATRIKGEKEIDFRPTSDRTRLATFNIIQNSRFIPDNFLTNAVVADIFCGSGSFGLEALSRGAKFAVFVDKEAGQVKLARLNAEHLNEQDNAKFIISDISFIPPAPAQCNIIFLDPPYGSKLIEKTLERLASQNWFAAHNIIIMEVSKHEKLKLSDKFEILDEREYGKTKLIFCTYQT